MTGKAFDIWLIPEFNGAATDMPIVEWIENMELVCELSAMDRVEHVLLLHLRGGGFAVYWQLSEEKSADPEEIKRALITTYEMDAFNAFDQFTGQQSETIDKFLADLHCLARLVGEPLLERWITCICVRAAAACKTASLSIIQDRDHDPGTATDLGLWHCDWQPRTKGTYSKRAEAISKLLPSQDLHKNSMLQLQWSGPRNETVQAEDKECMCVCTVTIATKQDIWLRTARETRTETRWYWSPLQTNYEWDVAGHPSPCQWDIMYSTHRLWLLLDHCKCGTLLHMEEEEHQSDHLKWWNVKVSWNKDSKGLHKHWEFCWCRSDSRWEAIRLWPAAGLRCHQSLEWCFHHTDRNGKVLRGGRHMCSTQDWPTWL